MLGPAIGDLLPLAVGVALSPLPIVAVVLMLGTPRAKANGTAFALGWILGLTVVSVLVLLVAGDSDSDSGTSDAVEVVKLAFGLVLLLVGLRQWRSRPTGGSEPAMPKWMSAIDSFTAGRSLVLGSVLSGLNPKNLALTLAASSTLAKAGLSSGDDAAGIAVFVLIGSLTVAGPVVAYLTLGTTAEPALASIKQAMTEHNAVIMTVVCVVLGAKLIGDAAGHLL